jgi:REP-associated tyrosine transposase
MDHRLRTGRRRSFHEPGHAHELTFTCGRRFRFLASERTCHWLAESIAIAGTESDFALWVLVFMPEHMHLIVWPRRRVYEVSDILSPIKEPVGRKAVKYLKVPAPD